ncbi:MAG TPA: ComEC/Rec2 family competence protein, partial [Puia sp.]|nr:ComEC/Rec2 family competence protein [Puia sp.]
MSSQTIPVWKEAPFLRLVIPLMLGIALQWYLHPLLVMDWCIFGVSCLLFLVTGFLKSYLRFRRSWLRGLILQCLLLGMGLLLTSYTDYTDQPRCMSRLYNAGDGIVASLAEPLVEKANSYKVETAVQFIFKDNQWQPAKGSILMYLQKDKLADLYPSLHYGDWIIFNKPLSPIINTGNPGAFDRQRYCKLQHIYFQVYLGKNEFARLPAQTKDRVREFFFVTREKIVFILRRFLRGDEETGLAEALLIGYKNDLDKNLVQAYSNTGTIHIIAISGLHLALIYGLLKTCLGFIGRRSNTWIRPVVIIFCLWGFSILSGASASVLRSAMMFSCIVIGDAMSKKTSIYNTLSASAFFLLCYNPLWLWDLGFQLSYAAVLSIVMFMKPIYHLIYIQSKIPDLLWKSIALTLSAQILTLPICIYQFHQFPNYFLLTNLLAVPWSSVILLGELLVCAIAFVPAAADLVGSILSWMIAGLNG